MGYETLSGTQREKNEQLWVMPERLNFIFLVNSTSKDLKKVYSDNLLQILVLLTTLASDSEKST